VILEGNKGENSVYCVYHVYCFYPICTGIAPGNLVLTYDNRVRFEFNYVDVGGQISNRIHNDDWKYR